MSEILCKTCGKPIAECTCQKGITATVVVQGKDEIEKLQKQLTEETSEIGSVKKYMRDTLKKYGIETKEDASFNELKAQIEREQLNKDNKKLQEDFNARRGTPSGGAAGKAPMYGNTQYSGIQRDEKGKIISDWKNAEFETLEEMVQTVREIADNERNNYAQDESDDAKKILNKLIQKSLESETKEPSSMTYTGSLNDLVSGKGSLDKWKKTEPKEAKAGED